jgi:hypothetical protein
MAKCKRLQLPVVKICAGDLRHRTNIVDRVLGTPAPGQIQPPITFTPLKSNVPTGIQTVSGTARFDGVNIEDRPTHIFIYRRESVIEFLEHGNNFIQLGTRVFRTLNVEIKDEDPNYIAVTATERGVDTQAASEA